MFGLLIGWLLILSFLKFYCYIDIFHNFFHSKGILNFARQFADVGGVKDVWVAMIIQIIAVVVTWLKFKFIFNDE